MRPFANAPSTCPPVCAATTNMVTGSTSRSASPQIWRWSSTQPWNSSSVSHLRTRMSPLICAPARLPFRIFRRVPQGFHLFPGKVLELPAGLAGTCLHRANPPRELPIGLLERNLRIDVEESRQVYRREQQVAHFFFDLPLAPTF